jgi:hypothetical protein
MYVCMCTAFFALEASTTALSSKEYEHEISSLEMGDGSAKATQIQNAHIDDMNQQEEDSDCFITLVSPKPGFQVSYIYTYIHIYIYMYV